MKKFIKQFKKGVPREARRAEWGFAMLFTVLIISIMLSIALGIADITFKQSILSSLARDSQIAFYQADSGVECGMYYEASFIPGTSALPTLPSGTTKVPQQLQCGNSVLGIDYTQNKGFLQDYFVYTTQTINGNSVNGTDPCFSITFDKTGTVTPGKNIVSARGYSTCSLTPQQVERGLSVTY